MGLEVGRDGSLRMSRDVVASMSVVEWFMFITKIQFWSELWRDCRVHSANPQVTENDLRNS